MSKRASNRKRTRTVQVVQRPQTPLPANQVEEKVNPAYSGLISFSDLPQPHMMPKNYKTYAQEGYKGNDTLYKCINYIITNGAAIPPKLYTDKTCTKEIESHPLLDKLDRPNVEQNGVNYRKAVLGYFLVAGNAFQYAIRKGIIGPPDELWTLDPVKMKILPTKKRGIVGYEFDDFDGSAQHPVAGQNPIPFENIAHLKTWNPDDPLWGLSPIEVGAIVVDMQAAYRKWNLGVTQNGGKMSGYFTTPMLLDGTSRQKLEDKINTKYAGPQNAGRIGLLDGGLVWTNGSFAPNDMDWLNALKYNSGGLANLLNMPPQLIGDTSSTTYDNMQEAKAASYTEEIFPCLDELYSLWNMWLVPMYSDLCDKQGNPTAYLYYDKDSVEVVQAVIQARETARAQRANQGWIGGNLMLDEARALMNLPPLPKGAGQLFRLGSILLKPEDLQAYAEQSLKQPVTQPALVPENLLNQPQATPPGQGANENDDTSNNDSDSGTADDAADDSNDADTDSDDRAGDTAGKSHRVSATGLRHSTKMLDLRTQKQKQDYLAQVEADRATFEQKATQQLQTYFKAESHAVTSALKNADHTDDLREHLQHTLDAQQTALQHLIVSIWQDTAQSFMSDATKQFQEAKARKAASPISVFSASTMQYLLSLSLTKAQQISATTLVQLQQILADGVANGDSTWQIATAIEDAYSGYIDPVRAEAIAATEVCAASNWASVQAAQSSGLTLNKVWLASMDGHTRPAHAEADGQEVPMDEPFEVGGEQLDYPGAPGGSAANVIRCRCTTYYKRVADVTPDESSGDETSGDDEETPKSLTMLRERKKAREEYQKFIEQVL